MVQITIFLDEEENNMLVQTQHRLRSDKNSGMEGFSKNEVVKKIIREYYKSQTK